MRVFLEEWEKHTQMGNDSYSDNSIKDKAKSLYFYVIPILEALVELGGKATTKKVLEKVLDKVKDNLSQKDMDKLKSGQIKWMNTAQWARQKMVYDGLLSSSSPRGIWEITEKGRKYYYEHKK